MFFFCGLHFKGGIEHKQHGYRKQNVFSRCTHIVSPTRKPDKSQTLNVKDWTPVSPARRLSIARRGTAKLRRWLKFLGSAQSLRTRAHLFFVSTSRALYARDVYHVMFLSWPVFNGGPNKALKVRRFYHFLPRIIVFDDNFSLK